MIDALLSRLAAPALAAPMFLVSGPDLVIGTCRAGLLGTFPALNQRTSEGFEAWLRQIRGALHAGDAPFGVNLTPHPTNPRAPADIAIAIKYQAPVVITTLAVNRELVDAVHAYGGIVLHDAISVRHAVKAVEAGVDGVIAVCAGAGGHAGTANPFAFAAELLPQLRGKALILSGGISNGAGIAGAIAAGADMAALGTCFIATEESMAAEGHKQMICDAALSDIVYTDRVSGMPASFLAPSLTRFGILDAPADAPPAEPQTFNVGEEVTPRLWRDFWSAGQSVGGVTQVVPVGALCRSLIGEYRAAVRRLARVNTMVSEPA